VGVGVVCVLMVWYARPWYEARRVGLDWFAKPDNFVCFRTWTSTYCQALGSRQPSATLSYNPWTRGCVQVARTWAFSDSVKWAAVRDSLHKATGVAIIPPRRRGEPRKHVTVDRTRHFGTEELRVDAFSPPADLPKFPWMVGVSVFPRANIECMRPSRRHLVLLTPAQMQEQARAWIANLIGF
jgi:hypothetical protein